MSLVDSRRILGGLTVPNLDGMARDTAMRAHRPAPHRHRGPCELYGAAVEWAHAEPSGGFARCERGCGRWVFIPPATCIERIEPDAAHAVVATRRAAA